MLESGHSPEKTVVYNLLLGLFFLGVAKFGYYLDEKPMAGYTCPLYCEVDHKHYRRDNEEKETYEQRFQVRNTGPENASPESADSTECTYGDVE